MANLKMQGFAEQTCMPARKQVSAVVKATASRYLGRCQ